MRRHHGCDCAGRGRKRDALLASVSGCDVPTADACLFVCVVKMLPTVCSVRIFGKRNMQSFGWLTPRLMKMTQMVPGRRFVAAGWAQNTAFEDAFAGTIGRQVVWRMLAVIGACWGTTAASFGDEKSAESKFVTHQITGLFCPEREKDFQDLCEQKLAKFKLRSIDFANAEATFDYDPAQVFPGAKPEQVIERFDNEVRNVSRHTFGVKPLRKIPKEKLKLEEFEIVGLDCKACSLAVYEIIARMKGVEQATAYFKIGKATAWIDPEKVDRTEIETMLKQRGVTLKAKP